MEEIKDFEDTDVFVIENDEIYLLPDVVLSVVEAFYQKNDLDAEGEEAKKLLKRYHDELEEVIITFSEVMKEGAKNATN